VSRDFVGQTALITGSTSGIGRAVAEQLAARGTHVIVSGRDKTRGDTAMAKIHSTGGRADFLAADLGHIDRVRTLAAAATNLAGHVDVLVTPVDFALTSGERRASGLARSHRVSRAAGRREGLSP
jgi:short-subunit dehydrogenase